MTTDVAREPQTLGVQAPKLAELGAFEFRPPTKERRKSLVANTCLIHELLAVEASEIRGKLLHPHRSSRVGLLANELAHVDLSFLWR